MDEVDIQFWTWRSRIFLGEIASFLSNISVTYQYLDVIFVEDNYIVGTLEIFYVVTVCNTGLPRDGVVPVAQ